MRNDEILKAIQVQRMLLQNPYAFLGPDGELEATAVLSTSQATEQTTVLEVQKPQFSHLSFKSIERLARNLQRDIYLETQRQRDQEPINPILLLDPAAAATHLKIEFTISPGLGSMRLGQKDIEVAGLINRRANRISVSRRLKSSTHRFTGAHEIGHWLMHPGEVFHRDRPIDAPSSHLGSKDLIEVQANYFAAFFLMPRKLVTSHFISRFGTDSFRFTADQSFKLQASQQQKLMDRSLDTSSKAKILAAAEFYDGRRFLSMSEEFGVSIEAMAIQIRDLKLVE